MHINNLMKLLNGLNLQRSAKFSTHLCLALAPIQAPTFILQGSMLVRIKLEQKNGGKRWYHRLLALGDQCCFFFVAELQTWRVMSYDFSLSPDNIYTCPSCNPKTKPHTNPACYLNFPYIPNIYPQ